MKKSIVVLISFLCFSCGSKTVDVDVSHRTDIGKTAIVETNKPSETSKPSEQPSLKPTDKPVETTKPIVSEKPVAGLNSDDLTVIINKTHPLPETYVPSDLVSAKNVAVNKSGLSLRKEAMEALEVMFKAAKDEGINLILGSSYRSYDYQKKIYNNYVSRDGKEAADRYSAAPGTSEHQTGLAADISDELGKCYLKNCFKDTKEGIWLKDNAHNYGFVLRFHEGKEHITGYMFEPWHYRYVGIEEAKKIKESGLTLEEYYNVLD